MKKVKIELRFQHILDDIKVLFLAKKRKRNNKVRFKALSIMTREGVQSIHEPAN